MRRAIVPTAILAASGLAAGAALSAPGDPLPPSLDSSAQTAPLFDLRDMIPGDRATRCIALTASGGSTPRLDLGQTVEGDLAPLLELTIERGDAPTPAAAGSCDGFAPRATVYEGPMTGFSAGTDPEELAAGASRTYRLTVELPQDAPLDRLAATTARQDLSFTATFDDPPSAVVGQASPSTTCFAGTGDRPRDQIMVGGRRIVLIAGPARLLAPGEPLALRVLAGDGIVKRVRFRRGDGTQLGPIVTSTPGSIAVGASELATGTRRFGSDVRLRDGRLRRMSVSLRVTACPVIARAVAGGGTPREVLLRAQADGLTGFRFTLPAGVRPIRRGSEVTIFPADGSTKDRRTGTPGTAGMPKVSISGTMVTVTGLRTNGVVLVRLPLGPRSGRAALRARCAGSPLTTAMTGTAGIQNVAGRLEGAPAGCRP
jgi:hypothetical protein